MPAPRLIFVYEYRLVGMKCGESIAANPRRNLRIYGLSSVPNSDVAVQPDTRGEATSHASNLGRVIGGSTIVGSC
jgi:hypothetical protein